MVFGPRPLFDLLLAPPLRLADHINAGVQINTRYTNLGEAELVGTIVVAAIGKLVRCCDALLPTCDSFNELIEIRFAQSNHRHVARRANNIDAVDVDHGGQIARGEWWMLREIQRSEQALFLGPDGSEQDRPRRRFFEL